MRGLEGQMVGGCSPFAWLMLQAWNRTRGRACGELASTQGKEELSNNSHGRRMA